MSKKTKKETASEYLESFATYRSEPEQDNSSVSDKAYSDSDSMSLEEEAERPQLQRGDTKKDSLNLTPRSEEGQRPQLQREKSFNTGSELPSKIAKALKDLRDHLSKQELPTTSSHTSSIRSTGRKRSPQSP